MSSQFHIVYPRGDRNKLSVVEILSDLSYELNDYAVASSDSFDTYDEAADHARSLADANGTEFIPDDDYPEDTDRP